MNDLSRRRLIILLLSSYYDAQPGLHKQGDDIGYISRGKKSGSAQAPLHAGESQQLWREGSYQDLYSALYRLDTRAFQAVWMVWIAQRPANKSIKDHLRHILRYKEDAKRGMKQLEREMPGRIRVPLVVLENAGHVVRRV